MNELQENIFKVIKSIIQTEGLQKKFSSIWKELLIAINLLEKKYSLSPLTQDDITEEYIAWLNDHIKKLLIFRDNNLMNGNIFL